MKAEIDAELTRRGLGYLARGHLRNGGPVWCARVPKNHYPHKYTLAHGIAVWRWWDTLEEAAADLGIDQ